mmetsp:Transcript_13316/g.29921  ORF Transcript_13316/g.29921 Transcript_13316/m.29921 type:complete len:253 (-) Transcript_13316:26-784(-)
MPVDTHANSSSSSDSEEHARRRAARKKSRSKSKGRKVSRSRSKRARKSQSRNASREETKGSIKLEESANNPRRWRAQLHLPRLSNHHEKGPRVVTGAGPWRYVKEEARLDGESLREAYMTQGYEKFCELKSALYLKSKLAEVPERVPALVEEPRSTRKEVNAEQGFTWDIQDDPSRGSHRFRCDCSFPQPGRAKLMHLMGPWREFREFSEMDGCGLWEAFEDGGTKAVRAWSAQLHREAFVTPDELKLDAHE